MCLSPDPEKLISNTRQYLNFVNKVQDFVVSDISSNIFLENKRYGQTNFRDRKQKSLRNHVNFSSETAI